MKNFFKKILKNMTKPAVALIVLLAWLYFAVYVPKMAAKKEFDIAYKSYKAANYKDARKHLELSLKHDPQSYNILCFLASLLVAQNSDLPKAKTYLEKAMSIDYSNWQAYAVMGSLYIAYNDNFKANEYINKALDNKTMPENEKQRYREILSRLR